MTGRLKRTGTNPLPLPQGLCVLLFIQVKSFSGAIACRFFLGVFEAAVTPGLSLMTGFWYTRDESPLRQTIWYSSVGWGGMIGSLMAAGIQKLDESSLAVPKWEMIFIILGSITIIWGAVLYFFLADGPSTAFWLKPEYRAWPFLLSKAAALPDA